MRELSLYKFSVLASLFKMNMRKSIGVLATLLTLTALFSSVTANDDFSEMSPVPTREVLKCMGNE